MDKNQQSRLKHLIEKGKDQGFLTYAEVNDHLPEEIVDPQQIEDIIAMINDMGILVHEVAPDADSLLLASTKHSADDDAAEEAAATLVTVDSEFGRTTDPVRMYMREMGTVELLTREGEIVIAKRIEDGLNQVIVALASFPESTATLLRAFERVEAGDMRLNDLISGFVDPNADEQTAAPEEASSPSSGDSDINDDKTTTMMMIPIRPSSIPAPTRRKPAGFSPIWKKPTASCRRLSRKVAATRRASRNCAPSWNSSS